jgi:hypothetical protein
MGYLETAKRLLRGRESAPERVTGLPHAQGAKSDLSDKRLVRLLVPFPDMRAFYKWPTWRARVAAITYADCERCGRPIGKSGWCERCKAWTKGGRRPQA